MAPSAVIIPQRWIFSTILLCLALIVPRTTCLAHDGLEDIVLTQPAPQGIVMDGDCAFLIFRNIIYRKCPGSGTPLPIVFHPTLAPGKVIVNWADVLVATKSLVFLLRDPAGAKDGICELWTAEFVGGLWTSTKFDAPSISSFQVKCTPGFRRVHSDIFASEGSSLLYVLGTGLSADVLAFWEINFQVTPPTSSPIDFVRAASLAQISTPSFAGISGNVSYRIVVEGSPDQTALRVTGRPGNLTLFENAGEIVLDIVGPVATCLDKIGWGALVTDGTSFHLIVGTFDGSGPSYVGLSVNYSVPFAESYPVGSNCAFLFVGRPLGISDWVLGRPALSSDRIAPFTPAIVYARDFDARPFVYSLNNDEVRAVGPVLWTQTDDFTADIGGAAIAGVFGFFQGIFSPSTEAEVRFSDTRQNVTQTTITDPRTSCNDAIKDGRSLGLVAGQRYAGPPFSNFTLVTQRPSGTFVEYVAVETATGFPGVDYPAVSLFDSTVVQNGAASMTGAVLLRKIGLSEYLLRAESIKPKRSSVISYIGTTALENAYSTLQGPAATCQLPHDVFTLATHPNGTFALAAAATDTSGQYSVQFLDFSVSSKSYTALRNSSSSPIIWRRAQFDVFSDPQRSLPVLFNGTLFAFVTYDAAGTMVAYVGDRTMVLSALPTAGVGPNFAGAIPSRVGIAPSRNSLLLSANGTVVEVVVDWSSRLVTFNNPVFQGDPGRTL
eukprot:TRINITY_DN2397_c0_g1_i4.p1 TRINITY_DN2397_c0_g1~~TRINITY_DN2397_c0_g1_i4.p1  ORF type:complete len:720 (-),score=59.00 TRINITY_DN2397_c0_g1_i4:1411-3570(-)